MVSPEFPSQISSSDSNVPKYLLYDGHGPTRQLAKSDGSIYQRYNYDAYGNLHNWSGTNKSLVFNF